MIKSQPPRPWFHTFARPALPAGLKKAALSVGRIGWAAILVLLAAGSVPLPARANSSAQAAGYWRYVKTNTVLEDYPRDSATGDVHKVSISETGGSYHYETTFLNQLNIYQDDCTWALTIPTGLDKLVPGDTGDVTMTCTDSSRVNEGGQAAASTARFSVDRPIDPALRVNEVGGHLDGMVVSLFVYAQESKTSAGQWVVPDWLSDQMALRFYMMDVGYSERVYEWVPGEAVPLPPPPVTETVPPVTQTPPAGTCTATLAPNGDIVRGRNLNFAVRVVDDQNSPVTPQAETWLFNGAAYNNGSLPWDGKAVTVEYQYTCPLDGQRLSAAYVIPPQDDGSGWIVVVGGLGVVAAAGLAAVAAGAALIVTRPDKNTKPGIQPQPPKYILQVSAAQLKVKPGPPVPLDIQAWRIMPDGSPAPAPEAVIQVYVPPSPAGLVVSPGMGQGRLNCAFSIPKPTICAELVVNVTATAAGLTSHAQVKVTIVPLYTLKLEWMGSPPGRLQPGSQAVYARASLSVLPQPDAQSTPEVLAGKINLAVQGPNSDRVKLQSAPPAPRGPYPQQGFLWIPVTVLPPGPGAALPLGSPSLVASFSAGDERLEQRLPLELSGDLVLGAWVQGKNQAEVLFNKNISPPQWDFSDLYVYFYDPSDRSQLPAHPGFKYQITEEVVEFDPPVLRVKELFSLAVDQYTLRMELNPEAELEQHLGRNLEQRSGIIQVKLTVKGDDGKVYPARVTYQLRPQLELFAHGADIRGRTYKDIDLGAVEFVADGDDQLSVVVGCCRTDQPGPRDSDQIDQVDPAWWTFQPLLQGDADRDYKTWPPGDAGDGERSLLIQSRTPLLYQESRAAEKLVLKLEGTPTSQLPAHYWRAPLTFDLPLKPRFPDVRLWVVPGKARGTSEAWMKVFLDRDTSQPLPDKLLKVNTEAVARDGPALLTNSLQNETSVVTGADGSEQADLVYKGINWGNYEQAMFMVSCRLTNRAGDQVSEPVKASVNVKENVRRLLADLLARAEMLKLNNPYFKNRALGLSSLIDLTVYRPFVRGPVWNACEQFSGNEGKYARGDKTAKFAHDYVCSEFRDRIAVWLINRRHYQAGNPEKVEQITCMNGIEFEHFIIANGLHNYEGLFLSGMEPTEDPRGLDPWWKQHWDDQAYQHPDGLISNNWERYYCVESAAWLTVSLAPLAALGLLSGGGALSVLILLFGPIIGAYAAATTGEVADGKVYTDGEYDWFKKGNRYVSRQTFLKDWSIAHPNG